MLNLVFFVLISLCLYPLLRALFRKDELLQFPTLVSLVYVVFFLPSLVIEFITSNQMHLVLSYSLYHAIMTYAIYFVYYKLEFRQKRTKKLEPNIASDLVFSTVFIPLVLFALFFIDFSSWGDGSQSNLGFGLFFVRMTRPLAIYLLFRLLDKRSLLLMLSLLLWLTLEIQAIFVSGRRSETIVFLVTIAVPLILTQRLRLRKVYIALGVVLGFFVVFGLPLVREDMKKGDFSSMLNLSYEDIVSYKLSNDSGTDDIIESLGNWEEFKLHGAFSYGARYWNKIVFQFASTTLFGEGIKESLTIETGFQKAMSKNGRAYKNYITPTGFIDSYYDFGYFGVIPYLIFAVIMKKKWMNLKSRGDFISYWRYVYYIILAMHIVYDSISFLPILLIQMEIALFPIRKIMKPIWE